MPFERRWLALATVGAAVAVLLIAFASYRRSTTTGGSSPDVPPFIPGTVIKVAGESIDIGTPVVLWSDPIGFDAYSKKRRFSAGILPGEAGKPPAKDAKPERYDTRSTAKLDAASAKRVERDGFDLAALRDKVRLFVLHFDAVGSSYRCFRALHDVRGLSVHFMLDLDGTIYQTLDVRERAFHAAGVNDESVGVEIASIGAHSTPALLEEWYSTDTDGSVRNLLPAIYDLGAQRRSDYVPRPARNDLVSGTIHGRKLIQYDFTEPQYEALARLAAGLSAALPRIQLRAPTDSKGRVTTTLLDSRDLTKFEGIVGHYHVGAQKIDPGPAFDWSRFLDSARAASALVKRIESVR